MWLEAGLDLWERPSRWREQWAELCRWEGSQASAEMVRGDLGVAFSVLCWWPVPGRTCSGNPEPKQLP